MVIEDDNDLFIGDIDERDKFDFDAHLKMLDEANWLQQEKEFEETIREGNEILQKEIEMIQNSEYEGEPFASCFVLFWSW